MLENYELINEVIKTAEESQGSALEENEKYIQSITGSLNRLTSAWQGLWVGEKNRELITFFLDLATSILKVADEIGALKTLIIGGGGLFAAFKAIKGEGRLKKFSLIFI